MGRGAPRLEPHRRPAARRSRPARVGGGRRRDGRVREGARAPRRTAGHWPRRRRDRRHVRHDPAQDRAHARRHDRPRTPDRARRGGRDLDRGRRGGGPARPRRARRLLARRRRRRLHARRRPLLARPQPRHRRQPGDGDRGRHGLRRRRPHRLGERARSLLGAPRRRRLLRDRDRDRVQPLPDLGGLRRHPLVSGRPRSRDPEGMARLDGRAAGRDDLGRADPPVPADPGDPGAGPRPVLRRRPGDLVRRETRPRAHAWSSRSGSSAR